MKCRKWCSINSIEKDVQNTVFT